MGWLFKAVGIVGWPPRPRGRGLLAASVVVGAATFVSVCNLEAPGYTSEDCRNDAQRNFAGGIAIAANPELPERQRQLGATAAVYALALLDGCGD